MFFPAGGDALDLVIDRCVLRVEVELAIGHELRLCRFVRRLDGDVRDGHDVVRRRRGLVDQVDDDTGVLFCRPGQQGCSGRSSVWNLFFSIFTSIFDLVVLVVRVFSLDDNKRHIVWLYRRVPCIKGFVTLL